MKQSSVGSCSHSIFALPNVHSYFYDSTDLYGKHREKAK